MKKVIVGLTMIMLSVAGASIMNCNGTRFRSEDSNITSTQVLANLTALGQLSTLSASNELPAFQGLIQNGDYTLYYSEAPSETARTPLGTIGDFGTDWQALNPAPPPPITYAQIYLVVSADGTQAGMIIATSNGAGTAAPTPTPTTGAPTGTPAPTGTTNPAITYAYIAVNNGQLPSTLGGSLVAGNFSDTDWQIELNANQSDDIMLQSFDVSDGDLTNTVQMNIIHTADQAYMGKFTVTEPQ